MKQTFKAVAMAMLMALMTFTVNAADFRVDGINYKVLSFTDFTCEVTQLNYGKYEGDIVIPSEVTYDSMTFKVVEIGEDAFRWCYDLTSIALPDGLIKINRAAFDTCKKLVSIDLPDSLIEIGEYAFWECEQLSNVSLGKNLKIIKNNAFRDCPLIKEIEFPSSIDTIENYAFYNCGIENPVIPESAMNIGYLAFANCPCLTDLVIPNDVKSIAGNGFSCWKYLKSVEMGFGIKTIGWSAFQGCESLESVKIGKGVTYLDADVFKDCTALNNIEFGQSLKNIGVRAFMGCSSLETIEFKSPITTIDYGAFQNCTSLKSFTIPGTVTNFVQYYSKYPYSVNDEEDFIFGGCVNLKELIIEYGVETLEGKIEKSSSYRHKKDLDFLYMPLEKVTIDRELGNEIKLPYLKEIIFGEHVSLVQIVPDWSEELETITCLAEIPPMSPEFTQEQYDSVILRVPSSSVDNYSSAEVWKNFKHIENFGIITNLETEKTNEVSEICRYNLSGNIVNKDYEGLVIVRYSDGSTRKVVSRK